MRESEMASAPVQRRKTRHNVVSAAAPCVPVSPSQCRHRLRRATGSDNQNVTPGRLFERLNSRDDSVQGKALPVNP